MSVRETEREREVESKCSVVEWMDLKRCIVSRLAASRLNIAIHEVRRESVITAAAAASHEVVVMRRWR